MTDNQKEDKPEEAPLNENPLFSSLALKPKLLIGGVLVYAGLGIPFLLRSESDLLNVLIRQGPLLIGVVVALAGFSLMLSEIRKSRQSQKEDRFVDVDESRTDGDRRFQARVLNEIKSLKAQSGN
ncbi:MAG: hypothetical protein L3J01_04785 [Thiomicrorhabdus sp.]|nr:hypothetical protein [Thiomicrorhabdus sp.]